MKNFNILKITEASNDKSDGYFLMQFSYTVGLFKKKTVTEELLINVVDNYNIKKVGGGTFTDKQQQQIFVAISKLIK